MDEDAPVLVSGPGETASAVADKWLNRAGPKIVLPTGTFPPGKEVKVAVKNTTIDARKYLIRPRLSHGEVPGLQITNCRGRATAGEETVVVGANVQAVDWSSTGYEKLTKDYNVGSVYGTQPMGDLRFVNCILGEGWDPFHFPTGHFEWPDGTAFTFYAEHSAVKKARDDCFENDGANNMVISNCYAQGHMAVSCRPSSGNHYTSTKRPTIVVRDSLFRLVCQRDNRVNVKCPGTTNTSHAGFWKMPSGSSSVSGPWGTGPRLRLQGKVWLLCPSPPADGNDQLRWPGMPGSPPEAGILQIDPGADVRVYWTAGTPYPASVAPLPPGVRLFTSASTFNAEVERWRVAHGCNTGFSACTFP